VKFETTPRFDNDYRRLPGEHKRAFREVVHEFSAACDAYVAHPGSGHWPGRLRVHPRQSAPGIWEMTWSFASPAGRATFEFVMGGDETRVRWRRIGDHRVYREP
jgi:hypothetical protein